LVLTHLDTGKIGEEAAAAYLLRKGYTIAARNYRPPAGRGEIDLIAWQRDNLLVFIEVKTRAGDGFGGPTAAVNSRKMDLMARVAGQYMEAIGYEWAIRFDIIAVYVRQGDVKGVEHFEDVFFPGM
jgi:putative endonuclease